MPSPSPSTASTGPMPTAPPRLSGEGKRGRSRSCRNLLLVPLLALGNYFRDPAPCCSCSVSGCCLFGVWVFFHGYMFSWTFRACSS